MEAFDSEDLAKDVYQLDPEDDPPIQRSLGINWNLTDDNVHLVCQQMINLCPEEVSYQQ